MKQIKIYPGKLTLTQMREAYAAPIQVVLSDEAKEQIGQSVKCVENVIQQGKVVYGINTGFGLLASQRISQQDLELLQRCIVLSHAAGVGKAVSDNLVRLIILLKINSLARGYSGARLSLIEALVALINHEIYPIIPEKGSVGASGDLAPLAHMSLVLIGEGHARYQGKIISGKEALAKADLAPITLAAKEGLALLNGTQVSTAMALKGLFKAEELFMVSVGCGAKSVEAALGSRAPFDARIQEARGQLGQIDAAACFRHVLGDKSEMSEQHRELRKVQDPYSLRCQPQVLGACLTQLRQAAEVLHIEGNAASDNPLIFVDNGDIISGGNFHAEPVAMAADNIALAIAEMSAIAERRLSLLVDKNLSQLPPFLVENAGVNSGFMIAQVTAAALASQTKTLAFPSSVDSLPTSANQEDLVSMAPNGARRLWEMNSNLQDILAIEWLAATQGMDFRGKVRSSPILEKLRHHLREHVSHYDCDRYFAPDISKASELIALGAFDGILPKGILPSIVS